MNWNDVFQIVGASLFSVVSAGALVVGLASWLGKVWAQRILSSETHVLREQLANTQHALDASLESAKRELDFLKESRWKLHTEKIEIYRRVVDMVAKLLADLDTYQAGRLPQQEAELQYDRFNEQRIRLYGYLAMFAPQSVMDAQDRLVDHLLLVLHGKNSYVWSEVRELSLGLINEVRSDIGMDKSNVQYNGSL